MYSWKTEKIQKRKTFFLQKLEETKGAEIDSWQTVIRIDNKRVGSEEKSIQVVTSQLQMLCKMTRSKIVNFQFSLLKLERIRCYEEKLTAFFVIRRHHDSTTFNVTTLSITALRKMKLSITIPSIEHSEQDSAKKQSTLLYSA
jgi:hypothetical protein